MRILEDIIGGLAVPNPNATANELCQSFFPPLQTIMRYDENQITLEEAKEEYETYLVSPADWSSCHPGTYALRKVLQNYPQSTLDNGLANTTSIGGNPDDTRGAGDHVSNLEGVIAALKTVTQSDVPVGVHFSVDDHSFLAMYHNLDDTLDLIENYAPDTPFSTDINTPRTISVVDFNALLDTWEDLRTNGENDSYPVNALTDFADSVDQAKFTFLGVDIFNISTVNIGIRINETITKLRLDCVDFV